MANFYTVSYRDKIYRNCYLEEHEYDGLVFMTEGKYVCALYRVVYYNIHECWALSEEQRKKEGEIIDDDPLKLQCIRYNHPDWFVIKKINPELTVSFPRNLRAKILNSWHQDQYWEEGVLADEISVIFDNMYADLRITWTET